MFDLRDLENNAKAKLGNGRSRVEYRSEELRGYSEIETSEFQVCFRALIAWTVLGPGPANAPRYLYSVRDLESDGTESCSSEIHSVGGIVCCLIYQAALGHSSCRSIVRESEDDCRALWVCGARYVCHRTCCSCEPVGSELGTSLTTSTACVSAVTA